MRYRKLGSTGLDVSAVALGCWAFGEPGPGKESWKLDEEASLPLIDRALEAGITFFDTANVYSHGRSEEILGRALARHGDRDRLVVATKVFSPMGSGPNSGGLSRKSVLTELDASLRRLGTDYIDLYQIHRFDPVTPLEETLSTLDDAVRSGKVRYLGASSMFAWQFAKALHTARAAGWHRFVAMQDQYNLLYREDEREMVPLCLDEGVGLIPYSPLARGKLAREWGQSSRRGEVDVFGRQVFTEQDRPTVDAVGRVSHRLGVPRAVVGLAWLMHQPVVSAPIIGVTAPRHIADAVAAVELVLPIEDLDELSAGYTPRPVSGHS
jgi:aryl-alcohol dehydrogenase-like predicted oxidoreductase